ncbi:unnamed protein product, partial [Ectocarpus sp. 8 AP-2014]
PVYHRCRNKRTGDPLGSGYAIVGPSAPCACVVVDVCCPAIRVWVADMGHAAKHERSLWLMLS